MPFLLSRGCHYSIARWLWVLYACLTISNSIVRYAKVRVVDSLFSSPGNQLNINKYTFQIAITNCVKMRIYRIFVLSYCTHKSIIICKKVQSNLLISRIQSFDRHFSIPFHRIYTFLTVFVEIEFNTWYANSASNN